MNKLNRKGQKHGLWKEKGAWGYTHTFNYVNGLKNGPYLGYDNMLNLDCKGQYVNGQKEGEWFETSLTKAYTWLRTYSKGSIMFEKKYKYMGDLIHKAFFL
jgi:antitoxin component YwqK of YwqJK toxin-antitoxin module